MGEDVYISLIYIFTLISWLDIIGDFSPYGFNLEIIKCDDIMIQNSTSLRSHVKMSFLTYFLKNTVLVIYYLGCNLKDFSFLSHIKFSVVLH